MKPEIENTDTLLRAIFRLFQMGRLKYRLLAASFVLLLVSSVFEGFSFGLLVPFLKQASGHGTYEGWRNIPLIGTLLSGIHFEKFSSRLDWLLVIIVAAVLIRQVASYVSKVLYYAAAHLFEARLRIHGYQKLLTYGCLFFDSAKKGKIQNTLMRFTHEVTEMMTSLFEMLHSGFFAVVYATVLIFVSPWLCLLSAIFVPSLYLMLQKLFSSIHNFYSHILKQEQTTHAIVFDVFSNIKLVKALNRQTYEEQEFGRIEYGRAKDNVMAWALHHLVAPLQEAVITTGIALMIWISFHFYFKNDPSFLIKLIVALLLFRKALQSVNSMMTEWPKVLRRFPYVRTVAELLNNEDKQLVYSGEKIFSGLRQAIEFRSLSMGYNTETKVLDNISFAIPKGSFTAIVGESGAGKTTLVELLLRFYEYQAGDIFLDGISIRDYDVRSLRQTIGFVSQETLVLNDSILNNIRYAKPDSSQAEIMEAAEKARVLQYAQKFQKGMDTVVGDHGVKLSGGELQRLSIARVFLRKPSILILDEATSALDSVSEKMIQEALEELVKDRTTIAIAHRLFTIQHADQIIVLTEGRVIEQGSRSKLLADRGAFFKFWQLQNVSSEKTL